VPRGRIEILRAIPDDPQPWLAEPEIRHRSCSNLNTHGVADTTRRLAPWRGDLRGRPRERCMRFLLEHHEIPTNGIRLHVAQTGPVTGPLVLLLHGFPECWYRWRHQLPALAAAGYRAWAPDQRGYNRSEKPQGIAAYRLEALAADVIGLLDAAGQERACLVGHDWGGVIAWWIAIHAPHRLQRMVVINAPHSAVIRQPLRRHPAQWLRSSYIGWFQLPWIPELVTRLGRWRLLVRALQQSSRPGTFTPTDLEQYREAWS
jgi:epoxide hydrolase 4